MILVRIAGVLLVVAVAALTLAGAGVVALGIWP